MFVVGSAKKRSTKNKRTRFPCAYSVSRRRGLRMHSKSVAKMSRLDCQAMNPTESLMLAIQSFDVDTVEKFLKSDLEIEYRDSYQASILHTAVQLIDPGKWKNSRFKESEEQPNLLYGFEARRIVEVLLQSARFNVDALTFSCQTPLHLVVEYCRCEDFTCDGYKDMVNAIIKLLLKNNANINARNTHGVTPLMHASERGCSHIVQLLLDWRDDLGAGVVDFNARDIFGETALIKAAMKADVDIVELLLQHGCFDQFQDNRGFSALHAVINGPDLIDDASSDFLALIGVLASEETQVVLNTYAAHSFIGYRICDQWTGNDSIHETVIVLATRGGADLNSFDYRGQSVLDVAQKSKLRISQKTVEKLKEYGATSSALLNKHPECPRNTLQYTDKRGKTPLHRLSAVLPELSLTQKIEVFDFNHLLNSSPCKEVFEVMTLAKDHRTRTVLHYAVMPSGSSLSPDDIFLLINVLKLKRTINQRDNYGRTPLHYCEDEDVYKSLVQQGANENIQDIDGKTPPDLKQLRNEEHNRYHLPGKLEDRVNQEEIDAWMIWKDSEYAYRDQLSEEICNKVRQFMNRLSDEIRKRDPRFECRPVLIGSAGEGTKTGLPDEFDFNFILTNLSEVCEVVPSPQAPKGFIHLKRRSCSAEYRPKGQKFPSQESFNRLFNNDGFLQTMEIAIRFRFLYLQIMSEPEFWEGEHFFEWDQHSEVGRIYNKELRYYLSYVIPGDFTHSAHPCSTIQLKLNRPIEGRYMFTLISLDIVPCIKLNGWWPDGALSSVSDMIKLEGCHLMFDQPQRHYPWVPFSNPFARISFAPAEGRIIKECSAVERAAYMVGKQLLNYCGKPKLTYVLKTCLLYCMEALKNCKSNSLLCEDIHPKELRILVEKLMLCFLEFYQQDFLPCYMMPSFHLPIEEWLKSNHEKLLYHSNFQYPSFAYELYSSVCITQSPMDFCPPTPEPLSEKFNREELMRNLSHIEQKQVIYRRVQPESLAKTRHMVRYDRQSESQVKLSTKRNRRLQRKAKKTSMKIRDFT